MHSTEPLPAETAATPPALALDVRGLSKNFGAFAVTRSVDLALAPGARHAIIGPNGAGKTTLINLLSGRIKADTGTIRLGGQDITHAPPDRRVKLGLGRTFQINTLFPRLSVLENICLAIAERIGVAHHKFRYAGSHQMVMSQAYELLHDLRLDQHALVEVGRLAYGQQRLVEIAIALALRPKVLLLDEPAAGIPTSDSGILEEALDRLPSDITIVLIEHDMELVARFARRITVLVQGQILIEDTPDAVFASSKVREIYLGEGHHA